MSSFRVYQHKCQKALAWTTDLEDLKAGDVQDSDEAGPLPLGSVQGLVDTLHDPLEHALVQSLGDCFHRKLHLIMANHQSHVLHSGTSYYTAHKWYFMTVA